MTVKPDIKQVSGKLTDVFTRMHRFGFVIFIVFVALLYGYVLLRINNLSNKEPSQSAISQQVKAVSVPNIDDAVVKQLESLQDNSVSVQALFDQARSNPFE